MAGLVLALWLLDSDWPASKAGRILIDSPLADDDRGIAVELLNEGALLTAKRARAQLRGFLGVAGSILCRHGDTYFRMLQAYRPNAGTDGTNLAGVVMSSESYVTKYKALSAVSVIALIFMTAASSYFTLTEFVDTKRKSSDWVEILRRPPVLSPAEKEKLDRMNSELKSVNALIESMRTSADKSYPSMDLSVLDGKLDDLARRLRVLENAISSDPEKALVVPMLRKDHELLAKQFKDSVVAAKLDYDRLWGILMLLLTSIGAAVIGLSGWALKSIFTKPKEGADVD